MYYVEEFSIKDIGKPFKTIAQKVAPVGKTIVKKIAPVGKTIGKGVLTAGKGIGAVGKGVFGGFANFFKNIWKWLRWAFYIVVILLFIKYGLPVFRFVSGLFQKRSA